MSKTYKKKNITEEVINKTEKTLTKKEEYDLNKKKKEQAKKNNNKNKDNKKKITKKKKNKSNTPLGVRIFATVMLILMIASVIASAAAYLR